MEVAVVDVAVKFGATGAVNIVRFVVVALVVVELVTVKFEKAPVTAVKSEAMRFETKEFVDVAFVAVAFPIVTPPTNVVEAPVQIFLFARLSEATTAPVVGLIVSVLGI